MMKVKPNTTDNDAGDSIENLLQIMAALRTPVTGCPWDLEQTHTSLIPYCLEEAYEVVSSIRQNDDKLLKSELGDLLLQVVFHAQIARERGAFDFNGIVKALSEKLVFRHPHVFGDEKGVAEEAGEVLGIWERQKQKEKADRAMPGGLPGEDLKAFPATLRAQKVLKNAEKQGFRWESLHHLQDKLREEVAECEQAAADGNTEKIEDELGDVLFVACNLANWLKIDAETALLKATDKFARRYEILHQLLKSRNLTLETLAPGQWRQIWAEAKDKADESSDKTGRTLRNS